MKTKLSEKKIHPLVFGVSSEECVWSRAGLTKPMKCINAFDCLGCAFDQKIQSKFESQRQAGLTRQTDHRPMRLRMLLNQRKCRHMLSGRVDYKMCAHGYDCVRCPYDQMIDDSGYLPNLKDPNCEKIAGFKLAQNHYYHFGHTWARVEYGGRVRIGLDDFASRLLGPQDHIKLPQLGEDIRQGSQLAKLSREQNIAEVLSPVTGKVVAVNFKLKTHADTANKKPYSQGWFMLVHPHELRKSLKNLFFGDESLAWFDDEATRLNTLVSEQTGYQMAATGGEAINDIYGSVPGLNWQQIVSTFLGT